jgi:hypothetical protein
MTMGIVVTMITTITVELLAKAPVTNPGNFNLSMMNPGIPAFVILPTVVATTNPILARYDIHYRYILISNH